jgi:hypothetical protein
LAASALESLWSVWKDISKYKMWPRSIEYWNWGSSNYKTKAQSILNRYRILSI